VRMQHPDRRLYLQGSNVSVVLELIFQSNIYYLYRNVQTYCLIDFRYNFSDHQLNIALQVDLTVC
jgi:hypothetical protein